MDFVIEADVPMVGTRRGRKATQFPLHEMEVGDSFLIPCDVAAKNELNNWRRKLLVAKKAVEGTFSTATVKDGIRVWRTA